MSSSPPPEESSRNRQPMKQKRVIPTWLEKEWQSEFPPCLDMCHEIQEEALSKQLTNEQQEEVGKMISRFLAIDRDIDRHVKGDLKRMRKELFPLLDEIQAYWRGHGYSKLVFEVDGKKGIKDIEGNEALPAEFEDAHFTFDDRWLAPFRDNYVVKKNGKWGIVNDKQEVLLPFEYDDIYRLPDSTEYYVVAKDGKQGLINPHHLDVVTPIPITMDTIYYVPDWDLTLFTRDGKWGWWWSEPKDNGFFENYSEPIYDEIFVQRNEYRSMDDEDDDCIIARRGDQLYWILYWTIK